MIVTQASCFHTDRIEPPAFAPPHHYRSEVPATGLLANAVSLTDHTIFLICKIASAKLIEKPWAVQSYQTISQKSGWRACALLYPRARPIHAL